MPKTCKLLRKWQNFAKSGHTGSRPSNPLFVTLPISGGELWIQIPREKFGETISNFNLKPWMEKCFLNGKVFELLPDVEAEAADGPRGPGWNLKRPEENRNSWRCCCCCWCRCCCCCYCWWSNRYCKTLFVVTGGSVIWDNIRKSVFATIIKQKSFLFVKKSLLMSYLWCVKRSLNNCR